MIPLAFQSLEIASLLLFLMLSKLALARPTEPAPQSLARIEGCGPSLPALLANGKDFERMFGVQPASFVRDIEIGYAKDIADSCRTSPKFRAALAAKISRVCFVGAAGADEPLPYVAGPVLVIEAIPGEYDRKQFRSVLAKAIAKGSVAAPIAQCGMAGH